MLKQSPDFLSGATYPWQPKHVMNLLGVAEKVLVVVWQGANATRLAGGVL